MMTDKQKLDEIFSILDFLQVHVENHVKQSFTDLTFNMEDIIMGLLNVFERDSSKYENLNAGKIDFPAIDLKNDARDTAIQVTTVANARKVKKTIQTYKKHNIKYSNLIVIGFVKSTNPKSTIATVYGPSYIRGLVKHSTSAEKDEIYDILKRHIPLNVLSPWKDENCVDVVFDVINRSAVRDFTECEGDYDRMVDGMYEIKEIITSGRIKGKQIRAKDLVQYTPSIKAELSDIEYCVSGIIQICNRNKNNRRSDYLVLNDDEKRTIDKLKKEIINKTNKLARDMKLNKPEIVGGMT